MKFAAFNIIKTYDRKWLPKDLAAGLSVAAIAIPVGIAYAGITGLPLQTGLYACVLPMIAYALFGSSKQLIVGPDSATCILIASALAPLAVAGTDAYNSLSVMLALLVGVLCILFAFLRLDFIANFLSKPILNGYLNGLAISIIVGQFSKVFGFKIEQSGVFRMLYNFFANLSETHVLTFVFGITTFIVLRIFKRTFPKLPSPLITVAIGIILVKFFNLHDKGMNLVGTIPSGLPSFGIPDVSLSETGKLLFQSLGIVLISYCSFMLTNKSFASKNGYEIDANQDLFALGIANISSGFSQGFVISGADSRTAVGDAYGGKTQLTSIFASLTIIIVLLFLTPALEYLPMSILGAIVISASIGLFNFDYLKRLYHISKQEFILAVITSLCVLTVGVLDAVIFAVFLSLLKLLARACKPHDAILGKSEISKSFIDIEEDDNAKTISGILIYRFDAQLLFFNADYFKNRIRTLINNSENKINCLILDSESIVITDITGVEYLSDLVKELKKKDIEVYIARTKYKFKSMIIKTGLDKDVKLFDTVHKGVDYYLETYR